MDERLDSIRQQEHERDLQCLRGLRPIDDDFMRQLFRDNRLLAEPVLRIITGKYDLSLIEEETQKDFKRLVGARSLCLDVYARDSEGRVYDLEVQRADRARYYKENPEGVSQMCKVMEDMRNEAVIKANTQAIKNIMEAFKVDAEKAMDALKIPVSERPVYLAQL